MATYVFPGQGSQMKGMGEGLFEEFSNITSIADKVLGYSIKELCLEDREQKLNFTEFTQPALYVVNALKYLKKYGSTGKLPDYVAGHSLGEYNALFAAGVFDFETGLKLVKKRAELMGKVKEGAMAAVIGLTDKEIKEILDTENLQELDVANYNSPYQIVISGPKDSIIKAKEVFEKHENIRMFSILKVSGAFHSRYMEDARIEFEKYISEFPFSKPKIPIIANVDARPYEQSDIITNLSKQITHSVQWTDTVRYLMGKGETEFEEIGTGTVLTGLIRRIKKEASPLIVEDDDISLKKVIVNNSKINNPSELGSLEFKKEYNLKYAYIAGAMYKGISSKEMVVKMAKSGMMGILGTGGMPIDEIENSIRYIQSELSPEQTYGVNFLHNVNDAEKEKVIVNLLLKYDVKVIEASAFIGITPSLVKYKARGLKRNLKGEVVCENKIIAKISRPEVAEAFLSPAPERIISGLLNEGEISYEQAELLKGIPVANAICAEADSGGHTDGGVAYALFPAVRKLRDDIVKKFNYSKTVYVGSAGGIGTPEAIAASFLLGSDFIVTGSINQCTIEASTSDIVKDLLQQVNIQDTEYAPAGDMFEYGSKVRVLKKGVFFPSRANKLYALYCQYNSLDEIDEKTKTQLQEKYFKRSFESIYSDLKEHYSEEKIKRAEQNPKYKMALIFKWYFYNSTKSALSGNKENKVDFQVYCGPALGSFNQWVKGTKFENWRNRHVDEIALKLLNSTVDFLNSSFNKN